MTYRIIKQLDKTRINSHASSVYRLGMLLVFTLLLTSCLNGDSDDSGDGALNSAKMQILVSSNAVFLSEIGGEYQLEALVVDAKGIALIEQPTFVWTTDAEDVVNVSSGGLLTAAAYGKTDIHIAASGMTKTISVEISNNMTTLNAQVRYADKEYSSSGFTGRTNYYKTVRWVRVDLLGENGSEIVQTTYTDNDGRFSFTGILSSQNSVRVYAKTNETQGFKLDVKDRSKAIYAVNKAIDLSQLNAFSVDIGATNSAAGAFNILDVFTSAAQFTLDNSEATSVSLTAFWQPGNNDGTYYCTGFDSSYCRQGKGVYVFSNTGADTDEFDDDVLFHEFGHYFVDALSRDDSLGGCHLLSSKDLDLRLAWSEGWGDFFPAAVKSWLVSSDQSHLLSTVSSLPVTSYVDTYGNTQQIYIDIAGLSQVRYSSAANEMAVAKILWSLSEQYGMPAVVKVLTSYLPNISTPVNLESFWDGWLVEHVPTAEELTQLNAHFSERGVFYQEDSYESDDVSNVLRKAQLGQAETHYLYRDNAAVDLDIVAFDVVEGKEYTVKTEQLTSGADTYLRILDQTEAPLSIGGVVIANDDADSAAYYSYDSSCGSSRVKNNATALSSKVTFTAPSTGTYYAEVRTTIDAEPYLSAGRYGTYDLTVSQNN